MPDFERVSDKLMLDLARSPEESAYIRGYLAGKRKARKEVAVLVVIAGLFSVTIMLAGILGLLQ